MISPYKHNRLNLYYAIKGFTLIELLIVMVILGLSTSIIAPNMFRMIERIQKRGELDTIRQIAITVKERSFYSAKDYVISFRNKDVVVFEFNPTAENISADDIVQICLPQKEINDGAKDIDQSIVAVDIECETLKTIEGNHYSFSEVNLVVSKGHFSNEDIVQVFEEQSQPVATLNLSSLNYDE